MTSRDTVRHALEAFIPFVLAGVECNYTNHLPAVLACFSLIMLADEDLDVNLLAGKTVTRAVK